MGCRCGSALLRRSGGMAEARAGREPGATRVPDGSDLTRGATDRRSWERSPNVEQAPRASRCASSPGTLGCVNLSGAGREPARGRGGRSSSGRTRARRVTGGWVEARWRFESVGRSRGLGARHGPTHVAGGRRPRCARRCPRTGEFHDVSSRLVKNGPCPAGHAATPRSARRLVVMSLIAGLALIQAGCQSGPFGNCGSCGSCGFIRRTTDRILHRAGVAAVRARSAAARSNTVHRRPSSVRRRPPRRCMCRVRDQARSPRPCPCRPTIRRASRPPPRRGSFRSPRRAVPRRVPGPSRWATSRVNRRRRRPSGSTRALLRKPRQRLGRGARRPSRPPATTTIPSTICRPSGCPAR